MRVECQGCRSEFNAKPSRVRTCAKLYCSAACRRRSGWKGGPDRARRVVKTCESCRKPFEVCKAEADRSPCRYCSRACRAAATPKKTCPVCGAVAPAWKFGTYCSRACKNSAKKGWIEAICDCCGRTHGRRRSAVATAAKRQQSHTFCGAACRKNFQKGHGHPRWLPDRTLLKDPDHSDRTSDRMAEWRKAVFTRDDYTCRLCGDRSRVGHRVELNAHHITRFADSTELRFDADNGITLCEYCHKRVRGREGVLAPVFRRILRGNESYDDSTNETEARHGRLIE